MIGDLVRARSEARRRKREWEAWATKKYGGVGVAYNNPNVQYEKVDEMFKQEWAKIRPGLANLSIWTLVSYARKYDTLKKQLLSDNGQRFDPEFNQTTSVDENIGELNRRTSADSNGAASDLPGPEGEEYSIYFGCECYFT